MRTGGRRAGRPSRPMDGELAVPNGTDYAPFMPFETAPGASPTPPARRDAVALKTFFRLAAEWDLSADEQLVLLGRPGRSTYYRWRSQAPAALSVDTLERISLLLGIYKALQILFPTPERATGWLRRPNDAFGGRTALEVMLGGRMDDLYQVRRHLDAWRG
jgi:hypothetical protein